MWEWQERSTQFRRRQSCPAIERCLLASAWIRRRIDGKAFAANQTDRDARLDGPLEHVAENISITEALVAGARKCRMIRDSVLDTERACRTEIGQVDLHFTAGQPFRADRNTCQVMVLARDDGTSAPKAH
jgi:hypothetical protein